MNFVSLCCSKNSYLFVGLLDKISESSNPFGVLSIRFKVVGLLELVCIT